MHVSQRVAVTMVMALVVGCRVPEDPQPTQSDETGLPCPGYQCPCPCEEPLFCGPHGACTSLCAFDSDCGPAVGETCLGGMCGIACTPGPPDDCGEVGMHGAQCVAISGMNVCAYSRPAAQ